MATTPIAIYRLSGLRHAGNATAQLLGQETPWIEDVRLGVVRGIMVRCAFDYRHESSLRDEGAVREDKVAACFTDDCSCDREDQSGGNSTISK